ncbi:MAG TPA: DUF3365 domain-containing protein [Stellaceae bacterium]|nr:DUF3365 domain-containing protein [Stellaceae bacterium]
MTRRIGWPMAVALLAAISMGKAAAEDDMKQRMEAARAAAADFSKTLSGELQKAIAAGGLVNAIGVCNTVAPKIAAEKSGEWKMTIGRTSLKLRQPRNRPDAWELAQLQSFEQRKAAGESAQALEVGEYAEKDGKRVFRYMKAIPAGEMCLGCHGTSITPEVAAKLKALYPQDAATGFKIGDLRGAFTITETP